MNFLNKSNSKCANPISRSASDLCDASVKNGRLEIGCDFKESKYAVVRSIDDVLVVKKELQKLWSIKRPDLVLSIVGGDDNFSIPYQIRKGFKDSILKLAGFTNTYILTNGLNTGVSKLVGEAVANSLQNNNLALIGISSFSSVYLADEMEKYAVSGSFHNKNCFRYEICKRRGNQKYNLDKNHSHFILVKNSNMLGLGDEIDFRVKLEDNLSDPLADEKIPTFLIVLNGGKYTLKNIALSLKRKVPVLIIKGSQGCSDLIVKAIEGSLKINNFSVDSLKEDLKQLGFEDYEILNAKKRLKKIIQAHSQDLVSLFNFGYSHNTFDKTVFSMLARSSQNSFKNLELSLKWNLIDIANKDIYNGNLHFEETQLSQLFEMALIDDRPDFVRLFIENEIDINRFLTYKRLYFLYNLPGKVTKSVKAPFSSIYRINKNTNSKIYFTFDDVETFLKSLIRDVSFVPIDYYLEGATYDKVNIEREASLNKFMAQICNSKYSFEILGFQDLEQAVVRHPRANLFIWAILFNRVEIAKIFLQTTKHQIALSLLAKIILQSFSTKLDDSGEILKSAEDFEKLACGILEFFDKNEPDQLNDYLILNKIGYMGESHTLEIAVYGKCKHFVANTCVQNVLDKVWINGINSLKNFTSVNFSDTGSNLRLFISYISLGLLAPMFAYVHKANKGVNFNRKKRKSTLADLVYLINQEQNSMCRATPRLSTHKIYPLSDQVNSEISYSEKFWNFILAPRSHFVYETVFFLFFLLSFSYLMLCKFCFLKPSANLKVLADFENQTFFSTAPTVKLHKEHMKYLEAPHWTEYLVIFWVITFFCQEVFQLLDGSQRGFFNNLAEYIEDWWNYLDMTGLLLFLIGMIARFLAYFFAHKPLFIFARIILCMDLSVWYVRLLHVTLVFKSLGPKLVMIGKMIKDLLFFIIIMIIFMFAYGVSTIAVTKPGTEFGGELLKSIADLAFWQLFGEITFDLNTSSLEIEGFVFGYLYTMLYFLAANILLMNLLVAMFSSTVEKVHDNTDLIWKFQNYSLVYEYDRYEFLPVPPPFNLLGYLILYLIKVSKGKNHVADFSKFNRRLLEKEQRYCRLFIKNEEVNRDVTKNLIEQNENRLNQIQKNSEGVKELYQKISVMEDFFQGYTKQGNLEEHGINSLNKKIQNLDKKLEDIMNVIRKK